MSTDSASDTARLAGLASRNLRFVLLARTSFAAEHVDILGSLL